MCYIGILVKERRGQQGSEQRENLLCGRQVQGLYAEVSQGKRNKFYCFLLSVGAAVALVFTGIYLGQILTLMRSVFSDPYWHR
jgi:hypothetical protein